MSSSHLATESVPCRRRYLRTRRYRGRLFVASAEHAFELDDVAEFIFRQIDGIATLRQIGARMAAKYGIAVDDAVAECAELLVELAAHDVLEISD